jgi:hypothetical protein
MKKLTSVAAIALFAIAFTSCKKDYTCECSFKDGNGTVISTQTIDLGKQKKSVAESACSAKSTTANGATAACSLK